MWEPPGSGVRPRPPTHHVRADGSAVLLLADDEPLLERLRNGGRAPVMLQLADHAPVELRCRGDETGEASGSVRFGNWAPVSSPRPIRGLLWITGRLWLPDRRAARRMALQVADACPDDRLLDLDHGATLVRLDPGSAVLADGDGSAALGPVDLAAARPDPFCRMEDHWLRHLEESHPEVMIALARHLPPALAR
ncbi:MAG: hypothetical protein QOK35_2932, partial [Pseudonocardiales bacterium]|nr:hypothetical protein [Pseudonocardiales bacterium]